MSDNFTILLHLFVVAYPKHYVFLSLCKRLLLDRLFFFTARVAYRTRGDLP